MVEAHHVGEHLVDPDDDLLAVDRREGRHAEVARAVVVHDRDPAVLRMPALDDVEVRHDLERLITAAAMARLDEQDVLKLAVDPVADADAVVERIEVDVGGAAVDRPLEDLADQLRQCSGLARLLKLLANVAVELGAVRGERRRWYSLRPASGDGDLLRSDGSGPSPSAARRRAG